MNIKSITLLRFSFDKAFSQCFFILSHKMSGGKSRKTKIKRVSTVLSGELCHGEILKMPFANNNLKKNITQSLVQLCVYLLQIVIHNNCFFLNFLFYSNGQWRSQVKEHDAMSCAFSICRIIFIKNSSLEIRNLYWQQVIVKIIFLVRCLKKL